MKISKTTLTAFVLLVGIGLQAQPDKKKMRMSIEKVEAKKVAYITDRLDLSPEQAQVFWPVYNEFQDELNEARKKQLKTLKIEGEEHRRIEDFTDEDLKQVMEMRFAMEQKELDLKKGYHGQFLEVLEVKQVAQLYRAEHEFKRVLFEEMRSERGEHKQGPSEPRERMKRIEE